MGDFNFHFGNVDNNNSRKLHDIIDMFNLTQFVSEPTQNQGHLLDLVFSKQSYNIFISEKLHHGLKSDHTAILCKFDVSVPVQKPETFSYRYLKKIGLTPAPLNKISLTLSHKPVQTVTVITILKQKLFFFPSTIPSLIRILLALTTSPSLILQEHWIHSRHKTVHEEACHQNLSVCLFRAPYGYT